MIADKEPRAPLDCWAAKASREVIFVMMLGWNLDSKEGKQARMEPVCWGWRFRQWAKAESPTFSSLLPKASETKSRSLKRVPQICIDTDLFLKMLDDALECQMQVSPHCLIPNRLPCLRPSSARIDASSGERLCFQQPKQIQIGIFLTFPNLQSKSTLHGPGTMLPCMYRKPWGMVIGLGVGMERLCARDFISFNVSK